MRKVLFASYGGIDFSMISPIFPWLTRKGYQFAIMNRYDLAPSRRQLKGLTVFQPPDISRRLLSASEIERALPTFLDTSSIQHMLPVWRGGLPGLRYLPGWDDQYFDFALETLHRYDPDLVVLSLGEAETSIIRRVCDLTSRRHVCLVPQRYEFKSLERFRQHDTTTYMVAGEFGKERLIGKSIKPDAILVTGNPRFDRMSSSANANAHAAIARPPVRTILYTMQAVRDEGRLLQLLTRYVSSRQGVRLIVRPHPNLPIRYCLPLVRHTFRGPVSVALRGTLDSLLERADVLVTLWSLTVLEALIAGLPVISWKSDCFPEEMPFALRGDTMQARTYAQLEEALDRLLFDQEARRAWVEQHRDCHLPYTGILDGKAATRVADTIQAIVEDRYQTLPTPWAS